MRSMLCLASNLSRRLGSLKRVFLDQSGQDLVEYTMIVALVSLGSTAGIRTFASGISSAYANVGTRLDAYVTGGAASAPGQSGSPPGQTGNTPGQSGNTPGQSGSAPPGQSGGAPGRGREH
jgi:Flp pilus assembly pilin Flp